MVVGNGLIANSFYKYLSNDDIIIFASGVSNSLEEKESEYQREFSLLKSFIDRNKLLVYFSTCSIYDKSQKDSRYVLHKLKIEKYIRESKMPYIIFRLPIVVSNSTNRNTLTNYLFYHILNGLDIVVHKNACRYLIDINDVVELLSPIIENIAYFNSSINVCFDNRIKISGIISIFEKIINKKARVKFIDKGDCYSIDNVRFIEITKKLNFELPINYISLILSKYYNLNSLQNVK
jgi:nucleoside-diphosphate-sugar epimerase